MSRIATWVRRWFGRRPSCYFFQEGRCIRGGHFCLLCDGFFRQIAGLTELSQYVTLTSSRQAGRRATAVALLSAVIALASLAVGFVNYRSGQAKRPLDVRILGGVDCPCRVRTDTSVCGPPLLPPTGDRSQNAGTNRTEESIDAVSGTGGAPKAGKSRKLPVGTKDRRNARQRGKAEAGVAPVETGHSKPLG